MRNYIVLLLCCTVFLIACEKYKYTRVSEDFLQGTWVDYGTNKFGLGGFTYQFTFEGNQFKMHKSSYSDLVPLNCNNHYLWNNYAKGTFTKQDYILSLSGVYCDKNYDKLTLDSCANQIKSGNFVTHFEDVHFYKDTLFLPIGLPATMIKLRKQ